MELRAYQQNSIDGLYSWWQKHAGIADCPLLVLPTGAGKSVVIAELVRLLFDTWPESHPRTVVLVPSKELAEQNADKLMRILPSHIRVGYYSASLGRKQPDADVIVATIGSIAKAPIYWATFAALSSMKRTWLTQMAPASTGSS